MTRRIGTFLRCLTLLAATTAIWTACHSLQSTQAKVGPWNLATLSKPPPFTTGLRTGLVEQIYYEGEPLNGRPTRVYAWLGRPANRSAGKSPGMILVHGGGGRAFQDWATHWAQRGYVALAMDLAGNGPNGRLPDGGPDQADTVKFRNFTATDIPDMWTYHAVAAVIRGHSLLRSLPDVDSDRIGLTGISWGGYLTCITAGVDSRFKAAVPVYGCGFLGDNSVWRDGSLAAMNADARDLWLRTFDPSQYLERVHIPILFLNGTTDFAYPLDSYQKSYRLVPDRFRNLSIVTNLPHGHIWTFPEVDAFIDHAIRGTPALVKPGRPGLSGSQLSVRVPDGANVSQATLCYTTDSGKWQTRRWATLPAVVDGTKIHAALPEGRPLVAYLALFDQNGRRTSTDFIQLPAP